MRGSALYISHPSPLAQGFAIRCNTTHISLDRESFSEHLRRRAVTTSEWGLNSYMCVYARAVAGTLPSPYVPLTSTVRLVPTTCDTPAVMDKQLSKRQEL